MTIDEAVDHLLAIRAHHDNDGTIEVFFDCPRCLRAFVPNVVCAVRERMRVQVTSTRKDGA